MKEALLDGKQALSTMRVDYTQQSLLEDQCDQNPFKQFERWLSQAMEKDPYANAVTLSTVGSNNMPDARTVLLRNVDYGGFTFFTNYNSHKGCQIAANPRGCLLFFWKELERQVKVQGEIKFLPELESDLYFATRPVESQVGAWASQQSETVANRQALDDAFEREQKKYGDEKVPRPPHWGGYVLLPSVFEFWQGRKGRLHDRIQYTKQQGNNWHITRLMP